MSSPQLSKDEWIDLLEVPFQQSMDRVQETITNHPTVQNWLQSDMLASTLSVEASSNVQEASAVYGDMMAAMEDRFPGLLQAIEELTQGCGEVDIDWRPLSPQFSGLYVNFRRDVEVDLFVGLEDLAEASLGDALDRLLDKLPKTEPFPNRPNEVTGIFAHEGHCLAVRARDHNVEPGHRKNTFAIIKKDADPSGQLARDEVIKRILGAFSNVQAS